MKKVAIILVVIGASVLTLSCVTWFPEYNSLVTKYGDLQKDNSDLKSEVDSRPALVESQLNRNYPLEQYLLYPRQDELYRSSIDKLVGEVVVLSKANSASATIDGFRVLGRFMTDEGKAAISSAPLDATVPLYSSRITGTFSAGLSFAVGTVDASANRVYDLSLYPNSRSLVERDVKYLDRSKLGFIWQNLDDKYYDVYFVTAVEYRILSYKDYAEHTAGGAVDATAIKVNGKLFYSNEKITTLPMLFFTGINLSRILGKSVGGHVYEKRPFAEVSLPDLKLLEVNKIQMIDAESIQILNGKIGQILGLKRK